MIACPQAAFFALLTVAGLPLPVAEHRFAPPRRWRFDFAWPDLRVALELEGGAFGVGKPCPACKQRRRAGHTAIKRFRSDMDKYNAAAAAAPPWSVLRIIPGELCHESTIALVGGCIAVRREIN